MNDTKPIRPGEELNAENLAKYLQAIFNAGEISIEQFPSGNSNLTYCV
jgi:aminoglycoside phosphotransferase (APT) family kinase protein